MVLDRRRHLLLVMLVGTTVEVLLQLRLQAAHLTTVPMAVVVVVMVPLLDQIQARQEDVAQSPGSSALLHSAPPPSPRRSSFHWLQGHREHAVR